MPHDSLTIRIAGLQDLQAVVGLHAEDELGGHDDGWSEETRPVYEAALARLSPATGHTLYVAEAGGRIVGTFILSLLPGLTDRGMLHAELRSVQVLAAVRSQGYGSLMLALAEEAARAAGAGMIELTSNIRRTDAHRFYERNGYARSHAGFKKRLSPV